MTFRVEGRGCEVVTLNTIQHHVGIGTSLLEAVKGEAVGQECVRLWLVATNDNLDALRFFQRRDFELARVYRGAAEESRRSSPRSRSSATTGSRSGTRSSWSFALTVGFEAVHRPTGSPSARPGPGDTHVV